MFVQIVLLTLIFIKLTLFNTWRQKDFLNKIYCIYGHLFYVSAATQQVTDDATSLRVPSQSCLWLRYARAIELERKSEITSLLRRLFQRIIKQDTQAIQNTSEVVNDTILTLERPAGLIGPFQKNISLYFIKLYTCYAETTWLLFEYYIR